MAFSNLGLVMPVFIVDPADDAAPVQMHRWKSQMRELEDKTKAFIGFKAKIFLKVEGQCTEAMKGRIICQPPTPRKGFDLLTIIEGISIGMVGATRLSLLSMQRTSTSRFVKASWSTDKVKSKLGAMERVRAGVVQPSMVAEIAVVNRHDAPADSDCREAEDYAVAVCLVLQPNCPGIAEDDAVLV